MSVIRSLCVFCGSADGRDPRHVETAKRLGRLLAGQDVKLVYGGGNFGMMGALSDAVLANGGHVIGVIPEHLVKIEVANGKVNDLFVVDSMHVRKRKMFDLSDAVAILPGGLGTLDETFEILTWKQLRLHDKPVVIVDEHGYWKPLTSLIDHMIEGGFSPPRVKNLYTVVERVEDILPVLSGCAPAAIPEVPNRF